MLETQIKKIWKIVQCMSPKRGVILSGINGHAAPAGTFFLR